MEVFQYVTKDVKKSLMRFITRKDFTIKSILMQSVIDNVLAPVNLNCLSIFLSRDRINTVAVNLVKDNHEVIVLCKLHKDKELLIKSLSFSSILDLVDN